MNVGNLAFGAGALSSTILEGIKLFWRKVVVKDPTYDFPVWFYTISLPLLNAVMPFVMVFLGLQVEDPILTMDLEGVFRYLALILVSTLVSLATNTVAIKPFKTYVERQSFKNNRLVE